MSTKNIHYMLLGLATVLVATSVAMMVVSRDVGSGAAYLSVGFALIAVAMSTGKKSNG